MRSFAITVIVLAFVAAGCVEQAAPVEESTPPSQTILPDFKPVAPTEENQTPSLLEAPRWKQGEWWRVRLSDVGFTGQVYETTRVVVGMEGDYYLVGMPAEEFSDDFMVLHVPGFGQVFKEDLSFEIHNALFAPLVFPLTDGATWETAFEGRPVNAQVHVENPTRARIEMHGAQDNMNLTYDATMREVVKYDSPAYANYEVLEHGYNYTGLVTVPHQHKLVFAHFRIGGVLTGVPAVGTSLTDTVTVDSTFDRVSFGLIHLDLAGTTGGAGVSAGYYHEKATAPGGATYELTVMPGDSAVNILTVGQDMPGGEWTFEHQAAGPGIIGAEGIAYHIYNVEMPSGRVQPSMGEHNHGQ